VLLQQTLVSYTNVLAVNATSASHPTDLASYASLIQNPYPNPNRLFSIAALMMDYKKIRIKLQNNGSRQKLKKHLHYNRQTGI